jgi:hypothetical protein
VSPTYRKHCGCHPATASGPRCVTKSLEPDEDGAIPFSGRLVDLACDECDEPWKIATPNPEPTDER